MAYDEELAERVRDALADEVVIEKKMFGGLAFMVDGYMCCGIIGDELMVRVGPDAYAEALAQPHAREMDFTGRSMKGYVYVSTEGVSTEGELDAWIDRARAFVRILPPK